MHDYLIAFILGVVQGLTEFLPVSSSGHIEIAEEILGIKQENSLLMTIVLHGATALATLVVYRKDFIGILKGALKFKNNDQSRYVLYIIISMIPAGLVGFFLEDWLETLFDGRILFVGLMLVLTAFLLFLADKAKKTEKKVGPRSAFIIGIAQAIAILPGISRSGATISSSVLLGINREDAARFSFLMVIPLILGVILKKSMDLDEVSGSINLASLSIGFVTAFFTGILACNWMIKLVKQARLRYFSYYCLLVGIVAVGYALMK